MTNKLNNIDYTLIDFADPASLLEHGKKLEGHTFQDVLDAGIIPEGNANLDDYSSKAFKGGLGNLIEERWYGYKTNSDSQADFPEAGVELKTTCYDTKSDGSIRAGERLVLSMIQYDEKH